MKKIILLTAGVLFGTLAFASRTTATAPTGSSVSVMKSGTELVKVFYKALQSGDVTVSIFDAKGKAVIVDKIKNSDGFMRPYNFKNLPEGEYTIQIDDESGKQIEKINYTAYTPRKISKAVLIAKVPDTEGKFLVSGYTSSADKVSVKVYDATGVVIFEKKYNVSGNFGEVYNLQNIKGAYTIDVSDAEGTIKEYHNH